MTNITPIFTVLDPKNISFSIEFEGNTYPITLLESPSASTAWKKFVSAIEMVNTIRRRDGKPEIEYEPSLQMMIESMMVDVKLKLNELKNSQQGKKEESKTNKSKKQTTIGCPICGTPSNLSSDGNYFCSNCNKRFNAEGEYTEYPWYEEPPQDQWIKCEWLDLYNEVVTYIADHIVFSKPIFYHIYALWCISTYKLNLFNTTGYMNFEAAGNEKGKTRALEIGRELSYRCVLTTRPSLPFITKALTDGATIMIDQAENTFFERGYRTNIYDVWTSGYKRGICIGKLSALDHVSYDIRDTFGAKATSMQEDAITDNPIKARTFNIPMQKGTPQNKNIDYERSKKIRKKLYYFRSQEIAYNNSTILEGRIAELIDPLIYTARMLGLNETFQEGLIKYAFELKYEKADETSDTLPYHVLEGIQNTYGKYSQAPKEKMYVTSKIICDWLKEKYPELYATKNMLSPIRVGNIIKKMGFEKLKRLADGNLYDMSPGNGKNPHNLELIDKLTKQYRPDSMEDEIQSILNKFESDGAVISKSFLDSLQKKDSVDKLLELKKYTWLLEKIGKEERDASVVDVEVEPTQEFEDENPEDEEYKKYLESFLPDNSDE